MPSRRSTCGLRHPLQELLGVGRERLDVPALPLGVEGVEGKAALARAGGAGDDRERAVGQLDGDALQIVLASVDDADDGIGHGGRIAGWGSSGKFREGAQQCGGGTGGQSSTSSSHCARRPSALPLPFPPHVPPAHPEVPPPRLRDLGARLAWWASASRCSTATTCRRSCAGRPCPLGWVAAGIALASLDWIGGGLRLWICARHVLPRPSLKGSILAGGMGAWAGFITPLNSGAGPMTMYTLRRYGIPAPGGGRRDVHELRVHGAVLRPRGAAGRGVRGRQVARASGATCWGCPCSTCSRAA